MAIDVSRALARCNQSGISLTDDFHALTSAQVETLIELANADQYRKPANANGSRARYYFAALQRKAKRA